MQHLMLKAWLFVATLSTVSAAGNLCCRTPCGQEPKDCVTMRYLAMEWWEPWCDNHFMKDCSQYGAPRRFQNYCCNDNKPGPPEPGYIPNAAEIKENCANADQQPTSVCRDIYAMNTDPTYQAQILDMTVTLEDICLGTASPYIGAQGSYICGNDGYGFAGGEPHFKTWAGEWYDYHGVCDLVLMDAPDALEGLGLLVHIRTKARYEYSFIESAALQIGKDHVFEVSSWADYTVNGVQSADLPAKLGDYVVRYRQISEKEHQFRVTLDQEIDGEELVFNVFKDMVSVKVEGVTEESFGSSRGLLGTFGEGSLVGRNGTIFSLEDPDSFAEDWQVLPEEPKLFQNPTRFPQAPTKCTRPDPAAKSARRRLGETVRKEAAIAACAHWEHQDACVYDVMATGDLELAKSTPY